MMIILLVNNDNDYDDKIYCKICLTLIIYRLLRLASCSVIA